MGVQHFKTSRALAKIVRHAWGGGHSAKDAYKGLLTLPNGDPNPALRTRWRKAMHHLILSEILMTDALIAAGDASKRSAAKGARRGARTSHS